MRRSSKAEVERSVLEGFRTTEAKGMIEGAKAMKVIGKEFRFRMYQGWRGSRSEPVVGKVHSGLMFSSCL